MRHRFGLRRHNIPIPIIQTRWRRAGSAIAAAQHCGKNMTQVEFLSCFSTSETAIASPLPGATDVEDHAAGATIAPLFPTFKRHGEHGKAVHGWTAFAVGETG